MVRSSLSADQTIPIEAKHRFTDLMGDALEDPTAEPDHQGNFIYYLLTAAVVVITQLKGLCI